jgi:CRP/FNR family transcriptional regulator, cyclic AMP receptor protein
VLRRAPVFLLAASFIHYIDSFRRTIPGIEEAPANRMPLEEEAPIGAIVDPAVRALAALGHVRSYRKNAVIIQEGDPGGPVYIILSGRVRVFSSEREGREVVLDVLGVGEIVGEMALDGSPRSASVMTMEATKVAAIEPSVLRERLKSDVDVAMLLVTELLGRLRRTTQVVKQLALGDVYQRLAIVLKELFAASSNGETIEGFTQQDLADRIGSSRDMVNRLFRELERGGYITVARRRISRLKPLPERW